jgi:hypothetical protein
MGGWVKGIERQLIKALGRTVASHSRKHGVHQVVPVHVQQPRCVWPPHTGPSLFSTHTSAATDMHTIYTQ